jgi:hypothetical protein
MANADSARSPALHGEIPAQQPHEPPTPHHSPTDRGVAAIAATLTMTVTSHSSNHEHHDTHEPVATLVGHNHEYPNTDGYNPVLPERVRSVTNTLVYSRATRVRVGGSSAQLQTRAATN